MITVNKIRHVDFAERVLQENRADMIALGRALLADSQWVVKARENRWDDIRPCVSCCQGCVGNIEKGRPIRCLVNPRLGREKQLRVRPVKPEKVKRVLVVGGGPAGLEASIIAARRGHRVVLWEKNADLGGRLKIAAMPPGKTELDAFKAFLRRQAIGQGVEIVLNRSADVAAVLEEEPDAVVVATGAKPHIPEFAASANGFVKTVETLLCEEAPKGKSVVIIGGGLVGLETALYLLKMENTVTVVEMGATLGQDMPMITRMPLLLQLGTKGARLLTEARAKAIVPNGVRADIKGKEDRLIPADVAILCAGDVADRALTAKLGDHGIPVHAIGDCCQPGDMPAAVYQGFMVGLTL